MSEAEGPGATSTWVPDICTLPTAQRPLRAAEFGGFFASTVRDVERTAPTRLRLELEPGPETAARAARLAAAEVSCCSFFIFTLTATGQGLTFEAYDRYYLGRPRIDTIKPRNTPSPYSLPGLKAHVRPNRMEPRDSWMCPCSPTTGW